MTPTPTPSASSPMHLLKEWVRRGLGGDQPIWVAIFYLVTLALAEVLTNLVMPQIGIILHLLLLFLLLVHTAVRWQQPDHRFLLGLTLVPLIRVISFSLPLVRFPRLYWYLITSIPLFAAAYLIMHTLRFPWLNTRLSAKGWLWQLLIGLTGLGFGYIEYRILRPQPLVETLTWEQLWLPVLILLFSTGYLEELIFRRIMQKTAVERLGRPFGVIYVAIFFAVLHVGYKSWLDVIFVLTAGLFFGWIVERTGTILGVTLSHALTNIVLFLVMPFLF